MFGRIIALHDTKMLIETIKHSHMTIDCLKLMKNYDIGNRRHVLNSQGDSNLSFELADHTVYRTIHPGDPLGLLEL